ncbi:hypothetical protein [Phenylobacterium sp.]|jgi:hypothetical protein|uniref:hypothetical protein n=1 Tax=Phenylobacterium sp. TaxID=1871053 RepID=UPI002F41A6E9
MDDLTRLLVLLIAAGVAVTLLAGAVRWRMDEGRRVRRGLKAVLKGDIHGFLVARGRGRGVGFDFTTNRVAVVWDQGEWGLVYGLDELIGAEVIVDFQVVGRVHRGEARRALDAFGAEERVALRLVFDDLGHPDFVLDLWLPQDAGRRDELAPNEAIAEANRWLARIEALVRRSIGARRAAPTVAQPVAPEVAAIAQPAPAAREEPPFELQPADDEDESYN